MSERFLSKEYVDEVGNHLDSARAKPPKPRNPVVPDDVVDADRNAYKAARGDTKQSSSVRYDHNGLMALVCQHDIPLFVASIDMPSKQQKHAVALFQKLFSMIPADATVIGLYDIACIAPPMQDHPPPSSSQMSGDLDDEYLCLPEVQNHLSLIDKEAARDAAARAARSSVPPMPPISPSKRRIKLTEKAERSVIATAARREADNASAVSNLSENHSFGTSSSHAVHLVRPDTPSQHELSRASRSPHPASDVPPHYLDQHSLSQASHSPHPVANTTSHHLGPTLSFMTQSAAHQVPQQPPMSFLPPQQNASELSLPFALERIQSTEFSIQPAFFGTPAMQPPQTDSETTSLPPPPSPQWRTKPLLPYSGSTSTQFHPQLEPPVTASQLPSEPLEPLPPPTVQASSSS
ncbi:hypothetical protein PM082_020739 [Marasmius tenuissimus]|nr:hypothetical protein PM082_020739 [Marasmius tenuissimus]